MRFTSLLLLLIVFGCKNREDGVNTNAEASMSKSIENEKRVSDSINETWAKHYAFIAEKKAFDSLHNIMLIAEDLNTVNVMASQLEEQYQNSTNTYIQRQFPRIFNDGYYGFIDKNGRQLKDQIECVKMEKLHPKLCKLCLNDATRKLMRSQKVQEAYDLYLLVAENEELNLSKDELRGYDVIAEYLNEIKRENSSNTPQDSFEFKKALAAEKVCFTKWLSGESTDLSLIQIALSQFMLKFPNSDLVDDAAFLLLGMDIDGEGGMQEDESIKYNKLLRAFIVDYPNSNYKEKAWNAIIQNMKNLNGRDAEYLSEINKYLEYFPNGRLADDYRYYLKEAEKGK